MKQYTYGSRISRRGGVHSLVGGMELRRGHVLVKMYAKTKELGPIGGACAGHAPPRSANVLPTFIAAISKIVYFMNIEKRITFGFVR